MRIWLMLFLTFCFLSWHFFLNENISLSPSVNVVYENATLPEAFFCPKENCSQVMMDYIHNASSVDCAFYELDYVPLLSLLLQKNARIVIDDSETVSEGALDVQFYKSPGLMHNKFCILDKKIVITGSTNPTNNGFFKNNNNLIIFHSSYLAKNYEHEFFELWNAQEHQAVEYPIIYLNGYRTENYFCPDDQCQKQILNALASANSSIYFMLYSFTDDDIGKLLAEKHTRGLTVQGIMEKLGSGTQYSQYSFLKENGIAVYLDKNPSAFHHKVFIIDNRTVITGSFNPSKNANERNDENILITQYPSVVQTYLLGFEEALAVHR